MNAQHKSSAGQLGFDALLNAADAQNRNRRFERETAHLPGTMEQAVPFCRVLPSDSFNCVNVQLEGEDLDRLEAAIRQKTLPHTEGFFFGASDGSEAEGDLEFVNKAREALSAGAAVYYTAWW
ncbi:MAG: phosphoglycerate kinase [Gammaproteobacteria bacterium]